MNNMEKTLTIERSPTEDGGASDQQEKENNQPSWKSRPKENEEKKGAAGTAGSSSHRCHLRSMYLLFLQLFGKWTKR